MQLLSTISVRTLQLLSQFFKTSHLLFYTTTGAQKSKWSSWMRPRKGLHPITFQIPQAKIPNGNFEHTLNHGDGWETNLWVADLQQVDGFSADVDVVGNMSQEYRHAVLHVFGDQSVALHPEVFVCRDEEALNARCSTSAPPLRAATINQLYQLGRLHKFIYTKIDASILSVVVVNS